MSWKVDNVTYKKTLPGKNRLNGLSIRYMDCTCCIILPEVLVYCTLITFRDTVTLAFALKYSLLCSEIYE